MKDGGISHCSSSVETVGETLARGRGGGEGRAREVEITIKGET